MIRARMRAGLVAVAALACLASYPAAAADAVPQEDILNATVWMQTAVEYRANCLTVYTLAHSRLDEALADKSWTAYGQTGAYRDLPPAVILDVDETVLDNTPYEAGLLARHAPFDPRSWDAWIGAAQAKAVPGAVEFTQYAASRGVKVFYVTNRSAAFKEATKRNLAALGFLMGGNVDTLLMKQERPEWATEAKGARFAFVAKDYRLLLLFGDNFGDFTDQASAGIAERDKAFDQVKAHFGHDWMVLANPIYGSWESAAYGHNRKLSADEKRARKIGALAPWPPLRQ